MPRLLPRDDAVGLGHRGQMMNVGMFKLSLLNYHDV